MIPIYKKNEKTDKTHVEWLANVQSPTNVTTNVRMKTTYRTV